MPQPSIYIHLKVFSKSESRDFMAVFPDLVRELTVEGPYAKVPVVSRNRLSLYRSKIKGSAGRAQH